MTTTTEDVITHCDSGASAASSMDCMENPCVVAQSAGACRTLTQRALDDITLFALADAWKLVYGEKG